ncbi:MAG: hypothetical protein HZY76_23665 [Anaerolineae bacterium]|nr:MAG: hypothetical protein HZY76_23665 [Anaerolineae bacterium]
MCAPANADPAAAASTAAVLTAAEVIGGIQALYDQSLLVRRGTEAAASFTAAGCCGRCPLRTLHETAAAESRFAMLEIIREFALAQLRTSGGWGFQRRHALYFADWAAQAEAALNGPDQAIWLARLEQEADNLRTALAWLLANGLLPAAAGMACALGAFWRRRGHYSEGRHWLEQVLAQMAQTPAPGALRPCPAHGGQPGLPPGRLVYGAGLAKRELGAVPGLRGSVGHGLRTVRPGLDCHGQYGVGRGGATKRAWRWPARQKTCVSCTRRSRTSDGCVCRLGSGNPRRRCSRRRMPGQPCRAHQGHRRLPGQPGLGCPAHGRYGACGGAGARQRAPMPPVGRAGGAG